MSNSSDPSPRTHLDGRVKVRTLSELQGLCSIEPDGCWLWTRSRNGRGYGKVQHNGVRWYVHRLVYALTNGPIPDDATVDHICFNTSCANPAHLRLLSRSENASNQRSKLADYCAAGLHPKTPENQYLLPKRGTSSCRPCRVAAKKRWEKENPDKKRAYNRRPTIPIQPGDGDPRHGTPGGYVGHRCRCEECRAGWRSYMRDWYARKIKDAG